MKPNEQDEIRKKAQQELDNVEDAPWLAISSESDVVRKQFFFWLLVAGGERLEEVAERARAVLSDIAGSLPDFEFNVSFVELSEAEEIIWDQLEDTEVRHGVDRLLGQYPDHARRKEFSVFDRRI